LRVLHIGPEPDYGQGGGIDVATWPLLTAQVEAGIEVSLITEHEVSSAAYSEATRVGVDFTVMPLHRLETLSSETFKFVRRTNPDVIHFHSVFIPAHAQLARKLRSSGIPYVLSPHGGLNLWKGRLKKLLYGALVEKPYFRGAKAIFTLTEREEQLISSWLGGGASASYVQLPNSIPTLSSETRLWNMPAQQRLVYLGRFDIQVKGLDRLVEIARLLPDLQVRAYGSASAKQYPAYAALCRKGLPGNMKFLDPVRNEDKIEAFKSATMYVQPSRDEGFGMAIVEAMRLGVPVAITRGCDIADTVEKNDLGMILPDDPALAAAKLATAIAGPDRLQQWSRAGRQWTIDALAPKRIADITITTYDAVGSVSIRP
jgi:glycosyltransferase involved in cell wall biosynthesis